MAASLFRKTETKKTRIASERNELEELLSDHNKKIKSTAVNRNGVSWRVQLTITAELSTSSKWKDSNVEKRKKILIPCSMYVMNARDISTAPRWKLKP